VNDIISDGERQQQQLASSAKPVDEGNTAGLPVDRAAQTVGETNLAANVDDGVDLEEEFAPRSFEQLLRESAGIEGLVRLTVKPELNFVVNLFNDEVHKKLIELNSYELDDQKFNVIQPLSSLNERSHRIGVLRKPLAEFVKVLGQLLNGEERIVVSADGGGTILNTLVAEYIKVAENTLFANFPVYEGTPVLELAPEEGEEEGELLDARNYVRVRALVQPQLDDDDADAAVRNVTVTVKFIVHLRIPLLIREESNKFEQVIKKHMKYLENAGIKAGMPTTIYAGFNSQDLIDEPVAACFNWIRETDPEASVLSFRNVAEGGDFFGIQGFDADEYADNLFNGGDFLVAFNLEKDGE